MIREALDASLLTETRNGLHSRDNMGDYGRQREQAPPGPRKAPDAPFPADPDIYRALSLTNRYEAAAAFTFRQGL
jgi:hypothetical protein